MLTFGLSSAGISFIDRHPSTIRAMTSMRMAMGRLMESLVSDIDLLSLLEPRSGDDHLVAGLKPAQDLHRLARRPADPDLRPDDLAVRDPKDGRIRGSRPLERHRAPRHGQGDLRHEGHAAPAGDDHHAPREH